MDNRSRKFRVYLAALLPIYVGVSILFASILLTFIMPIILISKNKHFQNNLPHLIERISLLVIITFGDDYGASYFFTIENFSIYSVLISLFAFCSCFILVNSTMLLMKINQRTISNLQSLSIFIGLMMRLFR